MSSRPGSSDRDAHVAARDRPERIFADDELEQRRRDMLTSSDVRTCLSCGQREVVADGGGFKCRSCGAEEPSAASTLALVRDGTIFVGGRTEIDFRTPDYSVWLTIKGDDAEAEAVAAVLEATFGGDDAES